MPLSLIEVRVDEGTCLSKLDIVYGGWTYTIN
jgi:hypothetical protein